MEKTKSIISWGQLFLIIGTACLFLFTLTQRANYEPPKEIVYLTNYQFNSGAIVKYSGTETEIEIPSSYSLGPTTQENGTITFYSESEAFDFLIDKYAIGVEGYYDFYYEVMTQQYPWTYTYSLEIPSFIEGNDFAVTRIDEHAFSDNVNLTKVLIPDSIQSIGNFAFQNCYNLTNIEIGNGLTFIGDSTFWGCGMKEITLPDSLEIIYPYAFFWCRSLEKITIPKNVKEMTLGTFNGCENLTEVRIETLNQIEAWGTSVYHTFSNCTKLQSIYVPEQNLNYYKTTYPWDLYSSKYKILN